VKQFYTAPTAIRSLMRAGDLYVKEHLRDSLRILGSVGEPINPEAWRWYHDVVGDGRCPIVDTWWQTETGGHMITPLPNAWAQKPGAQQKERQPVRPPVAAGCTHSSCRLVKPLSNYTKTSCRYLHILLHNRLFDTILLCCVAQALPPSPSLVLCRCWLMRRAMK
jgi:hypothetical protein